jgi:hypothetical protein
MEKHLILGVHITDRLRHATEVQKRLTEMGHLVKTRLGLHETTGEKTDSPNGLLLLEMVGDEAACTEAGERLNAIEGVEVQTMLFTHA